MTAPDKFKARLIQLTLIRLTGLGIAAVGGAMVVIEQLPMTAHMAGLVLLFAGIGGMWIAQRRLLRRWRSEGS